jgi:signal transduction histidine kinase
MIAILHRVTPRRIASQIAALVVTALFLSQLLMVFIVVRLHPPSLPLETPVAKAIQMATLARMLEAASSVVARAAIGKAAIESVPGLLVLIGVDAPAETRTSGPPQSLSEALQRELGSRFKVFLVDRVRASDPPFSAIGPSESVGLAIRLSDGTVVVAPLPTKLLGPGIPAPVLIGTLGFMATVITFLSIWASRALAAPLERFTAAVIRFGEFGEGDETIPENGPLEVRRLAWAFARMRDQVRLLLDSRTRMLTAVSHDLRTPITRLQLRAEDIADERLRAHVFSDLGLMQRMVSSALSFLRDGGAEPRRLELIDLAVLVRTVCNDFADTGPEVSYDGPDHMVFSCDGDQVARGLANLVDNAIKFGASAAIGLQVDPEGNVLIEVRDRGPGMSDAEIEHATEPFFRGQPARSLSGIGDGFGLGLSITKAIAEGHAGSLTLLNDVAGGLCARLRLPGAKSVSESALPHSRLGRLNSQG